MSDDRYVGDIRVALANVLLQLPIRGLRRFVLSTWLGWELGENVVVGRGLVLTEIWGRVRIGDRVNIGRHARLDARGGLTIGDDVDIAERVTVLTADHDPDSPEHRFRPRAVSIGSRCWIATAAMLLPGTTMADGAVLGAGAVAHGVLTEYGIYAGNPTRLIRQRDRAAQQRILPYRRRLQ